MKHEGDTIPAKPDITFYAMPGGNGGVERRHPILADAIPMQPAMGEGEGGQPAGPTIRPTIRLGL
jgi:hypothetical protein